MDSHPGSTSRRRGGHKKVQFKLDGVLDEVRLVINQEDNTSHHGPKGKGKTRTVDDIPPLFRCKSDRNTRQHQGRQSLHCRHLLGLQCATLVLQHEADQSEDHSRTPVLRHRHRRSWPAGTLPWTYHPPHSPGVCVPKRQRKSRAYPTLARRQSM
jgi:hypothetical protein